MTTRRVMFFAIASLLAGSPLEAAILEGRVMHAQRDHRAAIGDSYTIVGSTLFEVGPGVELESFGVIEFLPLPALVSIDVADTSILMTLIIDQPLANVELFRFTEPLNGVPLFANASVDPSTNWLGFTPGRLTLSDRELILTNVSGLSGKAGQFIRLNVTPEPSAACLLHFALALVAAMRWPRRRVSR